MARVRICHHLVGGTLNTNPIEEAGVFELVPQEGKPNYRIEKVAEWDCDETCVALNSGKGKCRALA